MEPEAPRAQEPPEVPRDLVARLSSKVVGQPDALRYIAPFVQMHEAGLSPPDRPVGVFLLLGPTGTGKTRTVEALAEILHGSAKQLIKIDCAEYQHDHEIAKLIGAPPGYVGHRETKPLLTQQRLMDVVSPGSDLAIVLFDEIEKASPALTQLLLGVLDRATLRVGDNSSVLFEKTLIFMTSNLGAPQMLKEIRPDIGFHSDSAARSPADLSSRLESIAVAAVRKRFSPEFVNRIDVVITYRQLDESALAEILDQQIADLQRHVKSRLGERSFEIEVVPAARQLLLTKGSSQVYGARELKRTLHRMLTQPLAAIVAGAGVEPEQRVVVEVAADGDSLSIRTEGQPVMAAAGKPVVLLLDDNASLLEWLRRVVADTGVTALTAATVQEARDVSAHTRIDLACVDMLLPDGDGLTIALELLRRFPRMQVVVMSGMGLSDDEKALCERQDFPMLRKPFLAGDLTRLIDAMVPRSVSAGH